MDRAAPRQHALSGVDSASAAPPSRELRAIAGRAVRWYAAGAVAWIAGSDLLLATLHDRPLGRVAVDLSKGMVFVAVTSIVLWAALRHLTGTADAVVGRTVTEQRDFYRAVLGTSTDVIAIFDGAARLTYANQALGDVLGWPPHEAIGRNVADFLHPDDRGSAMSYGDVVADGGPADRSVRTFLLRHRDGSYRSMEVTAAPIALSGGGRGLVVNARDVTDRSMSERQLQAALAEDATGLPSLRMFVAEIDAIAELRPAGLVATVLLFDVDRFSDINALHGRAGGDAVLRELAGRVRAAVPQALGVWRHGADEILVVLLDDSPSSDGDAVQSFVDRIRSDITAPIALGDDAKHRVAVSVSVGAACVDLTAPGQELALSTTLLQSVEAALGEAKGHPDRMAVHVLLGPEAGDHARTVAQLRQAFERHELVVHYQPKVRLDDQTTAGFEALVRWAHPQRGLLAPDQFLPTVERANLSGDLTRYVLRDALVELERWLREPGCAPDFAVSVNISLDELRRRRFARDVLSVVEEAGADPRRLCLELTEQAMLADAAGARHVVDELRREGIQVAIDDFGTGYSTLEHIRVFEVDELKIDKRFVQHLGRSPADEAIVDSILAIARRLGVRVTAEGIERPDAAAYLAERGCALGQGYLFAPPRPAADVDACQRHAVR